MGYLYFFLKYSTFRIQHLTFSNTTAKALLKDSWPLVAAGLLTMIQVRIDQIMIQQMLGNQEAGYYSVAIRSIEYFNFLSVIINSSLFPALMTNGEINILRLVKLYQLQFYLGLAIAIILVIFGHFLMTTLYGITYEPAAILFVLSALRVPLTSLAMVRGAFITIHNYFQYSTFLLFISAILNIALNYVLIPLYGSEGAIVATLICSFYIFMADYFHKGMKTNFILMCKSMLFIKIKG